MADIRCDRINANVEIACNFDIASDKVSVVTDFFLSCNLFGKMKLKGEVKLSCPFPRHERAKAEWKYSSTHS